MFKRAGFKFLACLISLPLVAQTIAEKKASVSPKKETGDLVADELLVKINKELPRLRRQLDDSYAEVSILQQKGGSDEEFQSLLEEVNEIKTQILSIETQWREFAVSDAKREEEGYALWDQEETTLAQLVMEYGAMDYLYIVPPEMSALKLNMHSGIPIPRESWSEVLENHPGP